MNSAPGYWQNVVPVTAVVISLVLAVSAIVTAMWRLLRWQEARIRTIVEEAAIGWNQPITGALQDHQRRLTVLEEGLSDARREWLDTAKRWHERLDDHIQAHGRGGAK